MPPAPGRLDPLLTLHHEYLALGCNQVSRLQACGAWVADAMSVEEPELIRLRLQRQHALALTGSAR